MLPLAQLRRSWTVGNNRHTPAVRCARRGCRRVPPAMSSTAALWRSVAWCRCARRGYALAQAIRAFNGEHSLHHCAGERSTARVLFLNALPCGRATGGRLRQRQRRELRHAFSRLLPRAAPALPGVWSVWAPFFGRPVKVLLLCTCWSASRRFSSSVSACKLASG